MDIELLRNNYIDEEIYDIESLCKDLHRFLKGSSNIGKSQKTKYSKDILAKMSKMFSKRFGLNIELRTDMSCGACTTTINTGEDTSINRHAKFWETMSKEQLKGNNLSKKDREFLKDYVTLISETKKNMVKGVTIDLDKSKVYGLNKKVISKVWVDFPSLIDVFNLTYKEIMGVILHEIGHNFTSLMYMNKISGSSISHEESLIRWIGGDKRKLTIKIDNKDHDLKDRSTNQHLLESVTTSIKELKHTYSDAEREADKFATVFGYGEHLASALATMHNVDPKRSLYFTTNQSVANTIFASFYLLLWMPIYIAWVATGAVILDSIIFGTIFALFKLTLWGTEDSNKTTYDDVRDRLEKIKRNMIRSIREDLVPEEQLAIVLDAINNVESFLKGLNIEVSAFDAVYDYFNKTSNVSQLYKTLETLSENDLHYLKKQL